jgi:vacuolar-type H+-ATPase subunit H
VTGLDERINDRCEPGRPHVGWTVDTLKFHTDYARHAEEKFQNERDRRYAEVKSAEEKALKVKEQADRDALGLAREIQTYKDEKANELRSQIERERGNYASRNDLSAVVDKFETALEPLTKYVSSQQGRAQGIGTSAFTLDRLISLAIAIGILYLALHR